MPPRQNSKKCAPRFDMPAKDLLWTSANCLLKTFNADDDGNFIDFFDKDWRELEMTLFYVVIVNT